MKKIIFFSGLLFSVFGFTQTTQIRGLSAEYSRKLATAQIRLIESGYLLQRSSKKCTAPILNITQDKELNIYLAFGYMDVSGGQNFVDTQTAYYETGMSLDIDAMSSLKRSLQYPCKRATINGQFVKTEACDFKLRGDTLVKSIRDRFTGKNVKVRIRMGSASYTANDVENRSRYKSQQSRKSSRARDNFLSALQNEDVVIYLGHARSGGGPDFNPPVLYKNGNVNYPYYKKAQEGIRSMLSALNATNTPAPIIGVLACQSTELFSSSIRRYAPQSYLVTADELFDYNDILPAGYNMIEAILQQSCGQDYKNITTSAMKNKFLSFFE